MFKIWYKLGYIRKIFSLLPPCPPRVMNTCRLIDTVPPSTAEEISRQRTSNRRWNFVVCIVLKIYNNVAWWGSLGALGACWGDRARRGVEGEHAESAEGTEGVAGAKALSVLRECAGAGGAEGAENFEGIEGMGS